MFITVKISVTLHVKISLCVHYVMRDVTFGTYETLVMLLMCNFCLIMVAQFSLLLLCHFGVSACYVFILYIIQFSSCSVLGVLEKTTVCASARLGCTRI